MCGISGFIDFKGDSGKEILELMSDQLEHRGPDGAGTRLLVLPDCTIGLAHRRLSIIDLTETGTQPMAFDGVLVTFNGEIYNYKEIRHDLQVLGHTFVGGSDTEVILHAYKQWGINCIERFIGMFSFVMYDEKQGKLFCVRDRAGVKPFYYYRTNDLFLFASELKAFHRHPGFDRELDHSAVAAFMQFGNIPGTHCVFKNCNKLSPGHYGVFDLKSRTLELHKYWDVYDYYNKPKLGIDWEEAKTETENLLVSAASYRMIADVPVGVFLSGGYDSACLTALLQKNTSEKLKTYTIAVSDLGLNEAPFAKEVAELLGTDHHELECSSQEALTLIDQLPFYYDEPFADSSAIPTTLVCKMARKEVTVALSADAGDEVFAGYNRYDVMMNQGDKIRRTPAFLRKPVSGMMGLLNPERLPYFNNKRNFSGRYAKLKTLLKDPSDFNVMWSLSTQFTEKEWNNLFMSKPETLDTRYTNTDLKPGSYSSLSYIMAMDYQTYLPDDILQKVDRASMSVSLESREPYLDHRLIEWVAQLPDHFKYNKGIKKYLLKEITHKHIPKSMMERPKMGFAIPIDKWMRNELKDKLLYYLDENKVKDQGIFNPLAVKRLLDNFMERKGESGVKIWYLLMFQMWYEKWME